MRHYRYAFPHEFIIFNFWILKHENFLPSRYFGELVKDFETTMTVYRAQIDNLESHLAAGNESIINQLPNSLERLHQTFIALAANLQIILGQLDKMKQRYLAYRRHQGDTTDVFARKKTRSGLYVKIKNDIF